MDLLIGGILPIAALTLFFCGAVLRIAAWLRRPVPYQLTLFPLPEGRSGRVAAVSGELLLFDALYRENRLLWLWAWLFHFSLAMILAGHVLGIYFLRNQFTLLGATPEMSALFSRAAGAVAGKVMVVSLTALFCRRLLDREVRRLSEPLSWLNLLLLLAIASSGAGMYLARLARRPAGSQGLAGGPAHPRPRPAPPQPAVHDPRFPGQPPADLFPLLAVDARGRRPGQPGHAHGTGPVVPHAGE